MKIKPLNTERKPVDVSEWNDEVKAYFRPLNGFETLVFNDYFLEFYNKENASDDRFKAGFKAALLALVDEEGAALLTEEDEEAIRAASFEPILRVFSVGLSFWSQSENGKNDSGKTDASSETQATNGSENTAASGSSQPGSSGLPLGAKKN